MKKKKRTNKKFYSLFLFFIFSISIGYAFLSAMISIFGAIDIKGNTWNVYYDNINVKSGSITAHSVPSLGSVNSNINFSVSLINPGDFYEFTVDVVNNGTVDAKLDSFSITPVLDNTQRGYIDYIVTYENGIGLNKNQLVPKGDYVRLKVKVLYKTDYIGQYTTFNNINFSIQLNYVPSKNGGYLVENKGRAPTLEVISGDGTKTGDEICIGNECFYVMTDEVGLIHMLSKYNLHVGNSCVSSTSCTPLANPTGIQNKDAKGYFVGQSSTNPAIGTLEFSSTNYWKDFGGGYPNQVYDSNSNLYQYVESYKSYLSGLGVTINEARLITIGELDNLGCSLTDLTCTGAPSWVYSTSYWTNTADSHMSLYRVGSDGSLRNFICTTNYYLGLRPVIVISNSYIK